MKKIYTQLLFLVIVLAMFEIVLTQQSVVLAAKNNSNEAGLTREQIIISTLKSALSNKTEKKRGKTISEGIRPIKGVTLLLREARQNYDSWSEESRAYVDMFLKRPDDTTNQIIDGSDRFFLPAPVKTFEPDIATYPSIGGKFKFWYVDHTDPDTSGTVHAATLDYVKSMASAFDTVYQTTITTMGYPEPPPDSHGGDSKIDIYIMNCGEYWFYGYAVTDLNETISPSFMVMDNDYSEFTTDTTSEEEAMQVTAAHEFHHVIQFGINADTDGWLMEATSTWMEDQVFDDIDDNLQYLNGTGGFFSNPEESLYSEFHYYNSWLWLEYMETKWEQDAVKSIWVDYLVSSGSSLTAVAGVLADEGSTIRQAFSEFARVNYTQEDFYTDYQLYDFVNITNEVSGIGYNIDHSSDSSYFFDTETISLNPLATKYFKLTPGPSISTAGDNLFIYIDGTNGRQIDVLPVIVDSDFSITEPQFSLDSENDGTLVIENFSSSNISEVVLVLVNYSTGGTNASFAIRGELGSNGGGGGCFIGSIEPGK